MYKFEYRFELVPQGSRTHIYKWDPSTADNWLTFAEGGEKVYFYQYQMDEWPHFHKSSIFYPLKLTILHFCLKFGQA